MAVTARVWGTTRDTEERRSPLGYRAYIAPVGTTMPTPTLTDSAWTGDGWFMIPGFTGGPTTKGGVKMQPFKDALSLSASSSDLVARDLETVDGTIEESALDTLSMGLAAALLTETGGVRSLAEPTTNAHIPMLHLVLMTLTCDPADKTQIPGGIFYPFVKLSVDRPKFADGKNRTVALRFDCFEDQAGTYITARTASQDFDVPASVNYGLVPNITLLANSSAITALGAAGFSTISQLTAASAAVASGYVALQSPAAGLSRLYTTLVSITRSTGP